MQKVDGNTTGTYDGIVYIICGNVGKQIIITASGDDNDKFFRLNDCLSEIGCDEEEGSCLVIIEDYTKGKVYRYNNYGDKSWYECGLTEGFA